MIDIAIVGAGPAGMAAAIEARHHGLSAALFNEQPAPGGQIYRGVMRARSPRMGRILGAAYAEGRPLADAFLASGAAYHPGATVWRIAQDGLSWTGPGGGDIAARHVLVATGAMERPFALPGWTLPGVMTAGAAQILLKTSGAVADGAVFVGCGPLLYLVACQYLATGAKIAAILDTANAGAARAALRHLPRAMRQPALLGKGAAMLARLGGAVRHRHVTDIAFLGTGALERVRWRSGGREHELPCRNAFLHHGIIPNPNMTMAARAAHRWSDGQSCWQVEQDGMGRTSLPWLRVAGDGGRIGGARAAALSGRLAVRGIVADGGAQIDTADLRRALAAEHAARPFLDRLYRPAPAFLAPADDATIICRCEEVTRGDLARAVAEGCPGPNQFKAFTRAGMGPCQGRMCGPTVAAVIADLTGRNAADIGYFRLRMPVKPVTIGEIAGMSPPVTHKECV